MAKFIDSTGNTWYINLNVGMVEDVKEKTSVDMDLIVKEPENLAKYLSEEPRKMAEMLYVLCEEQIKDRAMTPRDFGRLLNRETLDAATDCFLEAIVTFYPRGSVGQTLRENLPQILQRLDKTVKKETEERLKKLLSMPID